MLRVVMSIVTLIWQILLSIPFIVFAYWYQQEEASYRDISLRLPNGRTMFRHGAYGLFFGISFMILGLLVLPPITKTITLVACAYLCIRALDNIEHDKVAEASVKLPTREPSSNPV
jgi:uncharacterized membrane protein